MDLTQDQLDKIVFTVTEKVLLRMPEVIGHLIMEHTSIQKLTKGFYADHPKFKEDVQSVRSIISKLEKEDVTMEYGDILKKAAPLIAKRIKDIKPLSTGAIDDDIHSKLDMSDNFNGAL